MKKLGAQKPFHILIMLFVLIFGLGTNNEVQAEIGPLLLDDLVVSTGISDYNQAAVAFDGNRYLVVWTQVNSNTNNYNVYGRFVTAATGEMIEQPFLIGEESSGQAKPAVAFNGEHYLVVYTYADGTIKARFVDKDGNLIDTEKTVSTSSGDESDVGTDGNNFLIVWEYSSHIYGQLMTAERELKGDNFLISGSTGVQGYPSVEFGSCLYLVVWRYQPFRNGPVDLYGNTIDTDGTVDVPFAVSTADDSQCNQFPVGISFNDTTKDFLVVWNDYRNESLSSAEIYGTRINEETRELLDGSSDTGGILISGKTSGGPNGPQAADNGTYWLVVWGGSQILGVGVKPDGTVLDTDPINMSQTYTDHWYPAIASDGDNFLATWYADDTYLTKYAQLIGPDPASIPLASAGEDQTVHIGDKVIVDGSHSSDPEEKYPLSYAWIMVSKPDESNAELLNASTVSPEFTADTVGDYVLELVVTNSKGLSSMPDYLIISTTNSSPIADAGADSAIDRLAVTVYLDGSGSYDPDGDDLQYAWQITSMPYESSAVLFESDSATPYFIPDIVGTYVMSLTVNDGLLNSDPSNVTVVVISVETATTQILQESMEVIDNIDLSALKNNNLDNALTNKINAVLAKIDEGLYEQALNQLENDVLRKTDGCAKSGMPDKNDWIEDCESQNKLYPIIWEAINLLREVI